MTHTKRVTIYAAGLSLINYQEWYYFGQIIVLAIGFGGIVASTNLIMLLRRARWAKTRLLSIGKRFQASTARMPAASGPATDGRSVSATNAAASQRGASISNAAG